MLCFGPGRVSVELCRTDTEQALRDAEWVHRPPPYELLTGRIDLCLGIESVPAKPIRDMASQTRKMFPAARIHKLVFFDLPDLSAFLLDHCGWSAARCE